MIKKVSHSKRFKSVNIKFDTLRESEDVYDDILNHFEKAVTKTIKKQEKAE